MGITIGRAIFRAILVSVFLLAAGCSDKSQDEAAAYQEGMNAYGKGDYAVALEKFKALAEHGNARAQFNLGVMYRQGHGVPQDDQEAVEWWNKAAEQGHAEAQDNLGLRYARGQGIPQDWVQAYKWFAIAAASGNQTAIGNQKVVGIHMPPEKIKEAQALADEWLEKHKK
jgi:hypothetical protein